MGGSHHEVAVQSSTKRQKGEHITVAIPDVDPLHSRWGFADGLHTALPHLRLSLALLALPLGFSLGGGMTQEGLLLRQAQHLTTRRLDGQHRLQQQAVVGAIADGAQTRGRGMLLVVQFGRVLDQQHPLRLAHRRSRLLCERSAHPRHVEIVQRGLELLSARDLQSDGAGGNRYAMHSRDELDDGKPIGVGLVPAPHPRSALDEREQRDRIPRPQPAHRLAAVRGDRRDDEPEPTVAERRCRVEGVPQAVERRLTRVP